MIEGYPAYHGEPLPSYLRFYDPRHWVIVLSWVFFRPSHLKQYLHCALPKKSYFANGMPVITLMRKSRPVKSLIMTTLVAVMILTSSLVFALKIVGVEVRMEGIIVGLALGVTLSSLFGFVFSITVCIAFGVVGWVTICVTFGVVGGIAASIIGGVVDGATVDSKGILLFIITLGFAGGLIITTVISSLSTVSSGVMAGIAFGAVMGLVVGTGVGVVAAISAGLFLGLTIGTLGGLLLLLSAGAGSIRLPFGLVEITIAAIHKPAIGKGTVQVPHPSLWDELSVFDLPLTVSHLKGALSCTVQDGATVIRGLIRNPFQGGATERSILEWLDKVDDPIASLYELLNTSCMNEPIAEPISPRMMYFQIQVRSVILALLAGRPVGQIDFYKKPSIDARVAWYLSRPSKNLEYLPLAPLIRQYASFLLDLEIDFARSDYESLNRHISLSSVGFDDRTGQPIYNVTMAFRKFSQLPHALELAAQWEIIGKALAVKDIEGLALFSLGTFSMRHPLVTDAGDFIAALGDVSSQVKLYQESTSLPRRNAALTQAIGMLQELGESVYRIKVTEFIPFAVIVGRWQKLVGDAAGELGEQTTRDLAFSSPRSLSSISELTSDLWQNKRILPFDSPYVTGRPVQPPLFVGRRDLLSRIVEQWHAGVVPDSIILYGHRRMGKSSILRNLSEYAPVGSLVVYFDLKSARATIQQPGDLLFNLASAIFDEASKRWPDLAEPDQNSYTNPGAAVVQFRRLVGRVTELLPDEHTFLVLALDEFEAIEAAVESGQLTAQIYDWLRALSQTPKVALIMAGLHTLDEMSRNYQQAFFDSYRNEKVSYLTLEASTQLITRPTPDFSLDYDREVVAKIHRLTAGQPLLIQRICSELVSHLNYQLFDLNLERLQRIGVNDLEAVLTDEFLVSESRYFDGIWRDQIAGYPEQQKVLQVLAHSESGLLMQQISVLSGLTELATSDALSALQRRDLVRVDGGMWMIIIPLFKRWLQKNGRRVINRDE